MKLNFKRAALGLVLALSVPTASFAAPTALDFSAVLKAQAALVNGLNMKAGDTSSYAVDLGGFIKGTLVMLVREEVAEGIWLVQDLDVQIQKQKVESLLDKNTGEVKRMIINGKEEAVKKQDIKILETKEATIQVPAGTFKTIYVKAHDNTQNQDIEEWINPKDVPAGGAVQIATEAQGMKVKIQLTSYKRN